MKISLYTIPFLVALILKATTACAQTDTLSAVPTDSLMVATTKIYKVKDLYSLKPTYEMYLEDYFTDNEKLIDCNQKLISQVKKFKAIKDYKYFETNGGFGIISNIREIKPVDTNPNAPKRSWWQKLWGTGGPEITIKRAYIFMVIKSNLNEALAPNCTYLEKTYKSGQLERKWANIATLDALLNNPESKFNAQKHSFVVRVYEFKKGQLAKDYQFVPGDTNYAVDPKVAALFKKM
ncbi:MAG: hypothetical protein IPP30_07605 [Flavobacterium sp.]|nr:hypothetical protein [Flavobacterium sp.]